MAAAFFFLLLFLCATWFFCVQLRDRKTTLLALETELGAGLEREHARTVFIKETEALSAHETIFYRPFGSAKEAFDTLRGLLQRTGLSYAQFRRIGDGDVVRFEIAGTDTFPALLAFLDGLSAGEYPARVSAARMEGASGRSVAYCLTLDFCVQEGAAQ